MAGDTLELSLIPNGSRSCCTAKDFRLSGVVNIKEEFTLSFGMAHYADKSIPVVNVSDETTNVSLTISGEIIERFAACSTPDEARKLFLEYLIQHFVKFPFLLDKILFIKEGEAYHRGIADAKAGIRFALGIQ